ncbi:hypothetical protein [Streptomyces sp. ODS28]|uniref:hypothetical protein n=1 Tax=Streptomyces sp. ODS28 TaxID=3136688 RepID=UPI0031F0C173
MLAIPPAGLNTWRTGTCWLYCRRENVRVLRLGPVGTPEGEAHMYACTQCLAELTHMARAQLAPPRCEHRVLRRHHGKTRCANCDRQLYL